MEIDFFLVFFYLKLQIKLLRDVFCLAEKEAYCFDHVKKFLAKAIKAGLVFYLSDLPKAGRGMESVYIVLCAIACNHLQSVAIACNCLRSMARNMISILHLLHRDGINGHPIVFYFFFFFK